MARERLEDAIAKAGSQRFEVESGASFGKWFERRNDRLSDSNRPPLAGSTMRLLLILLFLCLFPAHSKSHARRQNQRMDRGTPYFHSPPPNAPQLSKHHNETAQPHLLSPTRPPSFVPPSPPEWRGTQRECEHGETCSGISEDDRENCVNKCTSSKCYTEVYAHEPVRG